MYIEEVQATLNSKKLNEKFQVKVFGVRNDLITKDRLSTSDNKYNTLENSYRIKLT